MATPTTRTEFKKYCLRELGAPVIEINVDEDQVEDRIDDALDYFRDFHYDGTTHDYYKHQITADDKTNGYITLPEGITGVVGVFPIGAGLNTNNLFNLRYQITLNEIYDWAHSTFAHYTMSMERIALMQELFVGKQPIRFNRHTDKLYIDMDWEYRASTGEYIIIECYRSVWDSAAEGDVWSDRWLRKYATQLIKRQWGTNLKKFAGMQLPGGLTFNGEQIYQEAEEEIKRLEEEVINTYSLPTYDMIG
jgi:hypothetical protein